MKCKERISLFTNIMNGEVKMKRILADLLERSGETDKQVRVLSLMSNPSAKDEDKYEVSQHWKDIYLTTDKENSMSMVPLVLREELIANGWEDRNGTISWNEDFQPEPVKSEDGNVYLSLNNASNLNLHMDMMMKATRMLMEN